MIRLLGLNTFPELSLFFLITGNLKHFGATFASLLMEDGASTRPLCSQVMSLVTYHTIVRGIASQARDN